MKQLLSKKNIFSVQDQTLLNQIYNGERLLGDDDDDIFKELLIFDSQEESFEVVKEK